MNKICLMLGSLLLLLTAGFAAKPEIVDEREQEVARLKQALVFARDSLQKTVVDRWQERQKAVLQRETDKENLAAEIERQEKQFNVMLSVKEEQYSLERRIESAQKELDAKKQEWNYVVASLREALDKEAELLSGIFPVDIDSSRLMLEKIRREIERTGTRTVRIDPLIDYCTDALQKCRLCTTGVATVLPDGEDASRMSLARFGTVFAYGMTPGGALYTITQSGRDGADRYRIRKIDNQVFAAHLTNGMPAWVANGRPHGTVTVDIMQSDLSEELVSGRKATRLDRAKAFFKAGGPVMFPLGLLPVWALFLIILKLLQFIGRRSSSRKLFATVAVKIDGNDFEGARTIVEKQRSAAARVAVACLDAQGTSRKGAESSVQEILLKESSHLGSHLNTLAVIAGVAPLLGLLGTVTGMIRLFEVITRFGTGDPKLLARGISEALITTEVGLVIAVPVLLAHNFLRNYKSSIATELQTGTLRLINRLFPGG